MVSGSTDACGRWHRADTPTGLLNTLGAAPLAHGFIPLRDIIDPHGNGKWEVCGVEETGKCVGKNMDSGVTEGYFRPQLRQ